MRTLVTSSWFDFRIRVAASIHGNHPLILSPMSYSSHILEYISIGAILRGSLLLGIVYPFPETSASSLNAWRHGRIRRCIKNLLPRSSFTTGVFLRISSLVARVNIYPISYAYFPKRILFLGFLCLIPEISMNLAAYFLFEFLFISRRCLME